MVLEEGRTCPPTPAEAVSWSTPLRALVEGPLAGARARGVSRRALRVRAASSPSSVDVAAPASVANPLAGVELFDVNGEAKAVPFWSEDQTVVVTFLRHFG